MRINVKDFNSNRLGMAALAFIFILLSFILIVTHFNVHLTLTDPFIVEAPKLVTLAGFSPMHRTIELQGSLIARSANNQITNVVFTMANASGAKPLKLTDDTLTIRYRDPFQRVTHLAWSKRFQGDHNHDELLDQGELVQFTVRLSGALAAKLGPNTPFVIDVIPVQGTLVSISRSTPGDFEPIMDFN